MIVVGAAIVRDGRVLAARRSAPPELAGRWEFAGGKREDGESDASALARECHEELGVAIEVCELLGAAAIRPGVELRIYRAALQAGEPSALQDHDDLRWLAADELDDVNWLPADRPVLAAVRAVLTAARPMPTSD
jgi:8-oxo-dGTP diphosphatase